MELQIQELISSIKKDGIDEANQEAAKILADAKEKSAQIVADAKKEAEQILEKAKKDADLYLSNASLSAQQAKRDATLAFGQEISAQLQDLLSAKVAGSLDDSTLVKLITAALQGEDASNYTAEVSKVTDELKAGLASKIKEGLVLSPNSRAQAGFRLVSKDGSGYFDCSEEELSKMLAPFFRDMHI